MTKGKNDRFRKTLRGGTVVMTKGVITLAEETRSKIVKAVRSFNYFTYDNDPYGEHDFRDIKVDGNDVLWKIDD